MPPRTTLNDKQVVVRRFMDILAAAGIYLHPQSGHRYIKWTFFPDHVWDRGVYVRLPREIIFENPQQSLEDRLKTPLRSPWTEETTAIMKDALDAGKVQVLPRPPDRPIVFEVFDQNGVTTDVGRFVKRERSRRRGGRESGANSQDSEDDDEEQDEDEDGSTDEDSPPPSQPPLKEIYSFLRQLYRNANLDSSFVKDEWNDLPRLLARRKLYMVGLPAICAPYVIDDEIDEASTPLKWTNSQREKFLQAARAGTIKLVRRDSNFLVLYQLANDDGSIHNSLLQYSPSWIQKNMHASIINNEMLFQRQRRNPRDSEKPSKVPVNATVMRSGRGWVVVEESTDEEEEEMLEDNPKEKRRRLRIEISARVLRQIVDFDIRGDGTEVTWNSLPLALAESNKYMTGIPAGGLPKIKDDKVVFQACHPSLWSHEVIRQMQENFDDEKVKVLPRPPGRIVLFEVEDDGTKYDTTLNFSHDWLAMHIDDVSLADRKVVALSRQEERRSRPPTGVSVKEKEENKKQKPPPRNTASGDRIRRLEERAQFLEDSQKGAANAKAVMGMLGFGPGSQQGNGSLSYGGNSKAAQGSGSSTPRSDPSVVSSHNKTPVTACEPPTPSFPAVHPRRAFKAKSRASLSATQNGSGNYAHLIRDDTTEDVRLTMSPQPLSSRLDSPVVFSFDWNGGIARSNTWPSSGSLKTSWTGFDSKSVLDSLVRFFERHAFATKPDAALWLRLPDILAERRQLLSGVPFPCVPIILNDQVDAKCEPSQWTSEMLASMRWAMENNHLHVKTRAFGRRALFEVIGSDGTYQDSTLGYSEKWLDDLLPDTAKTTPALNGKTSSSFTPIVTLKRTRAEATSPGTENGLDIERGIKRRKTGDEGDLEMNSSLEGISLSTRKHGSFTLTDANTKLPELYKENVEEESMDPRLLALERLVPRSLPPPLRNGRVFLRFGSVSVASDEVEEIPGLYEEGSEETWEWIPPQTENTDLKVSTIWNPTQARWRRVAEQRTLEHLGLKNGRQAKPSPDRLGGNILRRGQCHYNDVREQWEIDFGSEYKDASWIVRWDKEFGRWEWCWLIKN